MRSIRVPVLLAAVLPLSLTVACSVDSQRGIIDWAGVPDSAATYTLRVGPNTCLDCIRIRQEAVLGATEGPGFLQEASQWVAMDGLGRYWVLQPVGGPKVYRPNGSFLRRVGQEGEGPFEFQFTNFILADPDGRVHVFDVGNLRRSVIDTDFALRAEERLPGPVIAAAQLSSGGRYVANMYAATPEYIGNRLHVVEGGEVVASFDAPEKAGRVMEFRRVVADSAGTVYSASYSEYEIEVWTEQGRRIRGFRRPGLWTALPPEERSSTPVTPILQAIHLDAGGRLWVAVLLPRPDAAKGLEEFRREDGSVGLRPNDLTDLYEGVIEVIDLACGEIVASAKSDELILGFLADGIAHGPRYTEEGAPRIVISRLFLDH